MKGGENMPTVDFKFSERQRVKNAMGDEGIISMAGIQSGVKKYLVDVKGGISNWYDEDQLEPLDVTG
jgi:hypothetical protein